MVEVILWTLTAIVAFIAVVGLSCLVVVALLGAVALAFVATVADCLYHCFAYTGRMCVKGVRDIQKRLRRAKEQKKLCTLPTTKSEIEPSGTVEGTDSPTSCAKPVRTKEAKTPSVVA